MKTTAKDSGPAPTRRRTWVFRCILLLLPFGLLAAVEGGLRLAGHGGYPPVVSRVGNDGTRDWFTTSRPGVDTFFFTRRSLTGGMRETAFTSPKAAGTVRILLLGGSAMQGYPQERALTNGRFLKAMLGDTWGEQVRVEIINMGATAMASFPAVEFLDGMVEHQLDLVVVMSGNNEFYGAYGVASLHSSGTSPSAMRFTRWARGTAIVQKLAEVAAQPVDEEGVKNKPLMELVVAKSGIGPEAPERRAAARSLEANLRRMVRTCRRAGIPIVLCTLPTNEAGMAPMGPDALPPAGAEGESGSFAERLARAEVLLSEDPEAAELLLRDLVEEAPAHARLHYHLGQARMARGDTTGATEAFGTARDLDTMPWRATSSANDAVRRAADHGALLCDMEAAFRAASGGPIGWDLMDDHVHMSLEGQALFARTLVHTMTNLSGSVRVDPAAAAALPSRQRYADRLGANAFTAYAAASRMKSLFDIPFMRKANPDAAVRWDNELERMLEDMAELDRTALEHWRDPGLHLFKRRPITAVVGHYRMLAGDDVGAADLFRVARDTVANVSLWRLQYTWYVIRSVRRLPGDRADEVKELVHEAIQVGELLHRFTGFPEPLGPSFLGMSYHAAGDYQAAVKYLDNAVRFARGPDGLDVVVALADSLARLGRVDRAALLLSLAAADPSMKPTVEGMLADLVAEFGPDVLPPDARTGTPAAHSD